MREDDAASEERTGEACRSQGDGRSRGSAWLAVHLMVVVQNATTVYLSDGVLVQVYLNDAVACAMTVYLRGTVLEGTCTT